MLSSMKNRVVRAGQRALAKKGFALSRIRHGYEMLSKIPGGRPETILDIGANAGQFARNVRSVLPDCTIHAFEPLKAPFAILEEWARGDRNVHCHNIALGDHAGSASIHTGPFTPASSMIPAAARLRRAMPHVVPDQLETIEVTTLDAWFEKQKIAQPFAVKMDVQGYEHKVIAGGTNTISQAVAVLTEVSFIELYEGQPLAADLSITLRECGFEIADIYDVSRDPATGMGFQFDALFLPRRFTRA